MWPNPRPSRAPPPGSRLPRFARSGLAGSGRKLLLSQYYVRNTVAVRRLSVSITPELDEIVRALAKRMKLDLSRLVEILLRENDLLQEEVATRRRPGKRTSKRASG